MYSRMTMSVRSQRAMLAGGLAAFLLASIGFWVALGAFADHDIIMGSVYVGLFAAVLGAIVGLGGSTTRSLTRAGLSGASTIALAVGLPLVLGAHYSISVGEGVWLLAAACSFGSICAQVGAVASGKASLNRKSTQEEPLKPMRFSLLQLLVFFIPVAIFFGYASHFRFTQ